VHPARRRILHPSGEYSYWKASIEHRRQDLAFLALAASEMEGEREAVAVGHQVQLGPEAGPRATERVISRLAGRVFPPVAPGAGRMFVSADHGAVDTPERPGDAVLLGRARLELAEELLPEPARGPAPQPTVDGLPGPVALGQVPPRDAGVEDKQDAVEDAAVIQIRPALAPGRRRARATALPFQHGMFRLVWAHPLNTTPRPESRDGRKRPPLRR
jgi:hypothetical protein